jgi:hypothetical protein
MAGGNTHLDGTRSDNSGSGSRQARPDQTCDKSVDSNNAYVDDIQDWMDVDNEAHIATSEWKAKVLFFST